MFFISHRHKRAFTAGAVLFALLVIISCLRLSLGEWDIPLSRTAHLLSPFISPEEAASAEALVVRSVRLPRLLAAVGTGGLLGASGAVLQGVLANPLAEPYTLGIAAGAALGATFALVTEALPVSAAAFLGAGAALLIVAFIARSGAQGMHGRSDGGLVLAGVAANAVLSAGVTFLKATAGERLGAAVLWLMGSLAGAGAESSLAVWLGAAVMLVPAFACAPMLDAMSLGSCRGALLGVDEGRVRAVLLVTTSAGVAAAVSSFGIIGFVGLVVPHVMRLLVGPAHRPLLILSFLAGGCLLTAADGAAQMMGELPVGVLTALIGGPFFCRMLMKK